MAIIQRGSALALVLAAVVLIGISAFAFVNNLSQGNPDRVSPFAQLMNNNSVSRQDAEAIVSDDEHPSLVLEGDELNLGRKDLTAQLRFDLPSGVQSQLFDINTGKPIFTCETGTEICHLKPAYANGPITVQLLAVSSQAGSDYEFQKTFPLKEIDNSILSRVVMPVTIPITGFPDLYPQDYYFTDLLLNYSLPDNIQRLVNGKAPTGNATDFYAFDPGNVAASMTTRVTNLTDNHHKAVSGEFHISIRRQTQSQLYIYSVALIPLLFAFLFLHLLFFSTHFHHKVFEEFTEALIVAILAVLPLRAVLVPVELEGLTRVDLVLGMGLVLIVAVAVGKYATEVWESANPPKQEGAALAEDTHLRRLHETPEEEMGLEPEPAV